MANKPVDQIKVGQVEVAQWEGSYEGNPTTSFSLKKKKFNKDTKEFEESPFLNKTDLKDILVACRKMLDKVYQLDSEKVNPDDF